MKIYNNFDDLSLQNMLIKDGDSVNVISSTNIKPSNVLIAGEFLYPGFLSDISSGEQFLR